MPSEGASPVAVAQTRRVLFAKQLIHDSRLSMAEVAMASGFGSLRRFNETFRSLYHRPPGELRRLTTHSSAKVPDEAPVLLCIPYRPPYDWKAMLEILSDPVHEQLFEPWTRALLRTCIPETRLVDAASACSQCTGSHCDVLLIRHAWTKPLPEPSPYKDEPPPPAMFCQGDGDE